MQIEYIKRQPCDDRLLPNECGKGHVTRFFNFAPNHMFGIGEARYFKFRVLIDRQEY